MMSGNQRRHSYYAEAHAVSGELSKPVEPIAQVFLIGEADGVATRDVIFDQEDIVRVKFQAHTEVRGQFDAAKQVWITTASASLTGLEVCDPSDQVKVSAERIAATMTSVHDSTGYIPDVNFKLEFDTLVIDGEEATPNPISASQILGSKPAERYDPTRNPKNPHLRPYLIEYLEHPEFLANVKAQDAAIIAKNPPDWAKRKYTRNQEHRSKIECSLVSDTGLTLHRAFGHVVEIPNFGRLFLAELTVGDRFELNVLRLELCDLGDGYFLIFGGPSHNGGTRP